MCDQVTGQCFCLVTNVISAWQFIWDFPTVTLAFATVLLNCVTRRQGFALITKALQWEEAVKVMKCINILIKFYVAEVNNYIIGLSI